ncbi:MAG: hypothetical protein PHP30_06905 [Bacteroidales bacterium]|nr:hypothetical protein [Bacteroidales bacterium]MDD2425721.1 hypothetical protein [Bacteroidales bacterium]MDD3989802.1 hypothetical protein [Bacteroidales bacterium]MDD4639486.1 hypothetical protein [Bacteroidales bacterium]
MGNVTVKGRRVRTGKSDIQIYGIFSDLNNFTTGLPDDITSKAEISSTQNTLNVKVQGFDLGLSVKERVPYSLISMGEQNGSLFPFCFNIRIDSCGESCSEFEFEMEAELPGLFKSLIGSKLQEFIDKLTDTVEKSLSV